MSRSFYDIDPAGEVLCTYTEGGEKEKLRSVSWPLCRRTPRRITVFRLSADGPFLHRRKQRSPSPKPCSMPSSLPATRTP